jgi:hypothetical protein
MDSMPTGMATIPDARLLIIVRISSYLYKPTAPVATATIEGNRAR